MTMSICKSKLQVWIISAVLIVAPPAYRPPYCPEYVCECMPWPTCCCNSLSDFGHGQSQIPSSNSFCRANEANVSTGQSWWVQTTSFMQVHLLPTLLFPKHVAQYVSTVTFGEDNGQTDTDLTKIKQGSYAFWRSSKVRGNELSFSRLESLFLKKKKEWLKLKSVWILTYPSCQTEKLTNE